MEKAFGRVWHEGLLHKMLKMELPHRLIKITKSFLTDRTFSVKIDDQHSTTRSVRAGVPQGSCLSPILYLIFYKRHTNPRQSEHITIRRRRHVFYRQLQRQIDLAIGWFDKWRLRLNTSKTIAVLFGKTRTTIFPKL